MMKPPPLPPIRYERPTRVRTSEDSFITRSRGCGDMLLFGFLALLILIVIPIVASRGC